LPWSYGRGEESERKERVEERRIITMSVSSNHIAKPLKR
jgi:hypothetical protein